MELVKFLCAWIVCATFLTIVIMFIPVVISFITWDWSIFQIFNKDNIFALWRLCIILVPIIEIMTSSRF